MSLLTTASVWTNDDTGNNKRKSSSSIKKMIKNMTNTNDPPIENTDIFSVENYQNINETPVSVTNSIQANNERNTRVQQLLDQMSVDNDGNKLADFNPISRPQLNQKKDAFQGRTSTFELKPEDLLPNHPANNLKTNMNLPNYRTSPFAPDDSSSGKLSNYHKIYDPKMIQSVGPGASSRPYYSNMGIDATSGIGGNVDSKLLEKMNYLIHLLEEQQDEKTGHVTEEFMLYGFMGIFIIFVLDSFARAGKYVR